MGREKYLLFGIEAWNVYLFAAEIGGTALFTHASARKHEKSTRLRSGGSYNHQRLPRPRILHHLIIIVPTPTAQHHIPEETADFISKGPLAALLFLWSVWLCLLLCLTGHPDRVFLF